MSGPQPLTMELPSDPASIAEARHAAAAVAADVGADDQAVKLAVSEAVTNAVVHAYPDGRRGRIDLTAWLEPDALVVRVRDDGSGMRPNPGSTGLGIGLPLISRVSAGVEIEDHPDGGAMITMRFELEDG